MRVAAKPRRRARRAPHAAADATSGAVVARRGGAPRPRRRVSYVAPRHGTVVAVTSVGGAEGAAWCGGGALLPRVGARDGGAAGRRRRSGSAPDADRLGLRPPSRGAARGAPAEPAAGGARRGLPPGGQPPTRTASPPPGSRSPSPAAASPSSSSRRTCCSHFSTRQERRDRTRRSCAPTSMRRDRWSRSRSAICSGAACGWRC